LKPTRKFLMNNKKLEKFTSDTFAKQMSLYYKNSSTSEETFIEDPLIQPNRITKALYKCNVNTQKILCFAIKELMLNKNENFDRWISLDLTSENYKINSLAGKSEREVIKDAISEVLTLQMFIETDTKYRLLNVFEASEFDKKDSNKIDWKNIRFRFTELFIDIVNNNSKGNFTTLDLNAIKSLTSFYAIRFYEIAMSYQGFRGKILPNFFESDWVKENIADKKNTWCFGYSPDNLRILFGLEDKYGEMRDFVKKVINAPIKLLNETLEDLQIQVEIKRYGRNQIEGFVFWVTDKRKIPVTLSKKVKQKVIKNTENLEKKEVLLPNITTDNIDYTCGLFLAKYEAIWDAVLIEARSRAEKNNLNENQAKFLAIQMMNGYGYSV